jgi:drug/metabolite transporter (DMT)-like permease
VAAEPARPAGHRPRSRASLIRGIAFVVAATLLYTAMNTAVKLLRGSPLPLVELIWARSLGHFVLVIALFAPARGVRGLFTTQRPALQVGRSLLLLASTSLFVGAIGLVPLAEATAIGFTSPFVVAALAGPVLRERVLGAQWVAIAVGFLGALIVIRPGSGGVSPYAVLVLGSSACYAGYQVLTRSVASTDPPETSVTYSALLGTALLSLLVPFVWQTPAGIREWVLLGSLGVLGGMGHYCVARAFLWGPASVLAPFHYVQLIWASVMGYAVFGDVPGIATWLGAAVIIASGLYIAWREATRPAL